MGIVKKLQVFLGVLLTVGMLSACLPEDKDPNAVLSENTGDSGYYGVTLANLAVQIKNAIVTDSGWFQAYSTGQELNLAALGINTDNIIVPVKAVACSEPGGGVMQMLWANSRDARGNFAIERVGFNSLAMLDALKSRVSSNQLGIHENNSIKMMDDTQLVIPAGCALAGGIPKGAPVIAMRIDKPAVPTVQTTRTEYRTVECEAQDEVKQTGTKVQRRVVVYNPDGTMGVSGNNGATAAYSAEAGWKDENIGKCLAVVDVSVNVDEAVSTLGGALDQFAAIELKAILDSRIREIECKHSVVKRGADGQDINTCADNLNIQAHREVDENLMTPGDDTRILACGGNTQAVGAPSFLGVLGNTTTSSHWTGTTSLVRVRSNTQLNALGAASSQVKIGQWIGVEPNGVSCTGVEDTPVTCAQIEDNPTLRTPSPIKWRNTTFDMARTYKVISDCKTSNAPECINMTAGSLRYLDPDYFVGTSLIDNRGISVRNRAFATEWANRVVFKPRITGRADYEITRNQCEWEMKVMYTDCPMPERVTEAGTWNGTMPLTDVPYASYDNTPATLRFQDAYGGSLFTTNVNAALPIIANSQMYNFMNTYLRQVIDMYNQYTSAGHLVSTASRSYTRERKKGKGGNEYYAGSLSVGAGELYYRSWYTGSLNMDALAFDDTALAYKDAACSAGYVNSTICSATREITPSVLNALRTTCNMPVLITLGKSGTYRPNVSGALQRFCEHVFIEWIYATERGGSRHYRYAVREMADPNQQTINTTVLNLDGVIVRVKPNISSTQIGFTPPNFRARVGLGVSRVVSPLHCARQENDLVTTNLTITHLSYWFKKELVGLFGSSIGAATTRAGTTVVNWTKKSGFLGVNKTYYRAHRMTISALFKRTQVREYKSDIGWSRPRYLYYSPVWGSYSALPSVINYDIRNDHPHSLATRRQ